MCTYMTSSPNISRNCSNRQRYFASGITVCFSFNKYQRLTPNFFTNVEYFDLEKKNYNILTYMHTGIRQILVMQVPFLDRALLCHYIITYRIIVNLFKKECKRHWQKNWHLKRIGPRLAMFFWLYLHLPIIIRVI